MAITTAEREELHELVRQQLGTRGADLLMAGLATADLEAMEERLTLRIELVRAELRTETGGLRGEFGELRGEFGAEIGALRGELGAFRGEVGEEFGRIRGEMAAQNRIMAFATITLGIGIVSIVVGLAGLAFTVVQLNA